MSYEHEPLNQIQLTPPIECLPLPIANSPEYEFRKLFVELAKDPTEERISLVGQIHQDHINNSLQNIDSFRFVITSLMSFDNCLVESSFNQRYFSEDLYHKEITEYNEVIPTPKNRQLLNKLLGRVPVSRVKHKEITKSICIFDIERKYLEKHNRPLIYPDYWNSLVARNVRYPQKYMFQDTRYSSPYKKFDEIPFDPIVIPSSNDPLTESQKEAWLQLYEFKLKHSKVSERLKSTYGYGGDLAYWGIVEQLEPIIDKLDELHNFLNLKYQSKQVGHYENIDFLESDTPLVK